MSRWFRLYEETLDDPKVQLLPDALFKVWVNLLCLTSRNNGVLPPCDQIAFALRMTEERVEEVMSEFISKGLIDETDDFTRPHNWQARQYKSDDSNERVKRYRAKKCNGDVTLHVTPPETETETDSVVVVSREGPRDQSQIKAIESECRKAAGLEQAISASLFDMSPILGLMDAGADLTETILPAIAARPNPRASSWRYFVPQIQTAMQNRASAAGIQPQRPPDKPFGTASPPKRSGKATWMDAIIQGGRNEPDQRSKPIIDVTPNTDHTSAFG